MRLPPGGECRSTAARAGQRGVEVAGEEAPDRRPPRRMRRTVRGGDLAVGAEGGRGPPVPVEERAGVFPGAPGAFADRRIVERFAAGGGDRGGIVGRNEGARADGAEDVGGAAAIGGDDRHAGLGGFHDGQPEGLVQRRIREHAVLGRAGVEVGHVVRAVPVGQRDPAAEAVAVYPRAQVGEHRPGFATDGDQAFALPGEDHEVGARPQIRRAREGLDERGEVLLPDRAGHGEDDRPAGIGQLGGEERMRPVRIGRTRRGDAGMDAPCPAGGAAVVGGDLPFRFVARGGENGVGGADRRAFARQTPGRHGTALPAAALVAAERMGRVDHGDAEARAGRPGEDEGIREMGMDDMRQRIRREMGQERRAQRGDLALERVLLQVAGACGGEADDPASGRHLFDGHGEAAPGLGRIEAARDDLDGGDVGPLRLRHGGSEHIGDMPAGILGQTVGYRRRREAPAERDVNDPKFHLTPSFATLKGKDAAPDGVPATPRGRSIS